MTTHSAAASYRFAQLRYLEYAIIDLSLLLPGFTARDLLERYRSRVVLMSACVPRGRA